MSGEVASYIPELATADPGWFGISMVTADGSIYEVGDTRREFTIQSISKPLTFALALEAIGGEEVRKLSLIHIFPTILSSVPISTPQRETRGTT